MLLSPDANEGERGHRKLGECMGRNVQEELEREAETP